MSIDVQEYRRNKLIELLDKFKEEGKSVAKLAKEYPIDPSFISQLKNKHRGFGEDAARNLEKIMGLDDFYFEPYFENYLKSVESGDRLAELDAASKFSREVWEETSKGLEGMEEEFPNFFVAEVLYISVSEVGNWIDCKESEDSYRKDLVIVSSSVSISAYAILFETEDFYPAIRANWVGIFDPAYGTESGDLTHVILKDGTHFLKEYLYSKADKSFFASLNSNKRDSILSTDIKEMASLRSLMSPECLTKMLNI